MTWKFKKARKNTHSTHILARFFMIYKAKKGADGSVNTFVTGKVIDVMRNNADDW